MARKKKKEETAVAGPEVEEAKVAEVEEAHGDVVDEATAGTAEAQRVEAVERKANPTEPEKPAEAPKAQVKPAEPPKKPVPPATMVLRVDRLREALAILDPAVSRRTTLPVTEYVWLGEGRARATNLEVAVSLALPEAGDPLLLPHRQVSELLKYVPGHQDVRLEVANGQVKLTSGGSQASFSTMDPADFPPLPELKDAGRGVLSGDDLAKALVAVMPYVAREDSRPVLTAVALQQGEQVRAVAADGFRLAWEDFRGRLEGEGMLLIPARSVAILAQLWRQCPPAPDFQGDYDPVKVTSAKRLLFLEWTKKQLRVRFGGDRDLVLFIQLVEGTYPSYGQLIPQPTEKSFQALGSDLLLALKQLSRVARDGSGIVRLQWENNDLTLSCKDEELGEVKVTVPAQTREPGRIALNLFYLKEYLEKKEGMVSLAMSGSESSPVVLTYQGRSNQVIMPMFVQW